MIDMKAFSERLSKAIIAKGWTLSDLARKANVPKATIHNWTCGKVPRLTHLQKVSHTLEIPLYQLCFGGIDPHAEASSTSMAFENIKEQWERYEIMVRRPSKK
jgi:transcriptional regulator with XRE-family HTH domain